MRSLMVFLHTKAKLLLDGKSYTVAQVNKKDSKKILETIKNTVILSGIIDDAFDFTKLPIILPLIKKKDDIKEIIWRDDENVTFFPISIENTPKAFDELLEKINDFEGLLHEVAADTYLEGDAIVYEKNGNEYELVFDDITAVITENNKVIKKIKYDNYW